MNMAAVSFSDEDGHYDLDGVSLACDQVIVGSGVLYGQCDDPVFGAFFRVQIPEERKEEHDHASQQ